MKQRATIVFISFLSLLLSGCRSETSHSTVHAQQFPTDSTIFSCHNIEKLKQKEDSFISIGDRHNELLAKFTLGKRLRETSKFEEAINYHQAALTLAEELRDTMEIINTLNQIGTNFRRIGNLEEASGYLYKGLSYYKQYSRKNNKQTQKSMISILNGIGNVQKELNNPEAALTLFFRALQEEEKTGNTLGKAINYANIGSTYEIMGKKDSARVFYQHSMAANREINSKVGIGLCHIAFGNMYGKEGKKEDALREYKNAYEILLSANDHWHWLISATSIVRIYLEKNDLQAADKYLNECVAEIRQMKSLRGLREVYELKSQYNEQKGLYAEALKNYKQAMLYDDSLKNEKSLNHIHNQLIKFERETSKREADIIRSEKESQRKSYLIVILCLIIGAALIIVFVLQIHLRLRRRGILELKKKNEELSAMNHRAEKAEQIKTTFIRNISHEIRTPLNAISGFSQVIASDPELNMEERQGFSELIIKNTDLLTKLVNDILELGNMGTSKIQIHKAEVSAQEIIKELSRQMITHVPQGVRLKLSFPQQEIKVLTDKLRLKQILQNLISNACKNTNEGSISLSVQKTASCVMFTVTDTGCGIPSEKADSIFGEFEKLDNYKQGAGIGLSICRMIAEALDARIYLDKQYTNGARFVVEI